MAKKTGGHFIPGPWVLDTEGNGKEVFIEAKGDGWERLDCRVSVDDCSREAAVRTAKVICAVPELVSALLKLKIRLEQSVDFFERDADYVATLAALKKAGIKSK